MSRFTHSLAGIFLPSGTVPSISNWLSAARTAHRSRRHLGQLDAHQLSDVGISENAAKSEASRPIWDVPAHWTQ